jgi:5-methylcytosine-specific restriction endonuclease McrA
MKRKLNNKARKDDILRLRAEGKSYNEIQSILGVSKSVISYHCGQNSSEKKRVEARNTTASHKLSKKISAFKSRCSKQSYKTFRTKVKTFKKRKHRSRTHAFVNNVSKNFSAKDVIEKFGDNPKCYLTGKKININKPETYHLDHIIPTSKGGTNDLDNLGICTKQANYAKNDLSIEELYILCEAILKWKREQESSS